MEETLRRFPIGIQNFEQLRDNDCVYIDKTDLIYRLTHSGRVCFLSRPRRFGKSLLVSTLEAYFQGKKHLFEGLAMARLETEWAEYPVLHMDFSGSKYFHADMLNTSLNVEILRWEKIYGKDESETSFSSRFEGVIRRAYEKTGRQVVVLVDEYDAPLLDSIGNPKLQQQLRDICRDFFSPLKKCGQYLRFLFLTGISKFSQLSIFSELNNLQNISMNNEYSALCGITENELLKELKPYITRMAKDNEETYEEACAHLKRQYDGYHFSEYCEDIYNPFSLFCALDSRQYKNYWFATGTPTFLFDIMRKANFNVRDMEGIEAVDEEFDAPTECVKSPVPVLYQSGYLTIKGFDKKFRVYKLAYPNTEVRKGFLQALLPIYVNRPSEKNTFYVVSFLRDLEHGDINSCLERTRSFFASIPNDLENKTEKHYQTIFYLLFRLMGQYADAEVKTAIGRTDVVVRTDDSIYVFEFKFDGTPDEALAQIESKQYAIPYALDGRRVVKVGVNFDSATRTIGEWKIV